jgi:hypothetical protein
VILNDTGNVGAGAMLRLTDVKLALETLPVSPHARGEVVLEIDDPVLPANSRAYRVSAREGRLKVRPDAARSGVRPRLPRLRVPAEMLGPLVSGTLSPVSAAEVGLITSTEGAAEAVEPWFRGRSMFLYPLNSF